MTLEAGIINAIVAAQNAMATVNNAQAGKVQALAQLLDRLFQRLPV